MSKTPYEVRLETLQLAFDILREQKVRQDPDSPAAPTTAEIMQQAFILRTFVDNEKLAVAAKTVGEKQGIYLFDFADLAPHKANEKFAELAKILQGIDAPKEKQILNEDEAKRQAFLDSIKPEGDCCGAFDKCECRTDNDPGNNGC